MKTQIPKNKKKKKENRETSLHEPVPSFKMEMQFPPWLKPSLSGSDNSLPSSVSPQWTASRHLQARETPQIGYFPRSHPTPQREQRKRKKKKSMASLAVSATRMRDRKGSGYFYTSVSLIWR